MAEDHRILDDEVCDTAMNQEMYIGAANTSLLYSDQDLSLTDWCRVIKVRICLGCSRD